MDVPARTSYVMAVVSPAERSAAASVTNVPRSLAAALPPILAGWLLGHSSFGWPLVIGGTLKAVYDLGVLRQFRDVRPPEEAGHDHYTARSSGGDVPPSGPAATKSQTARTCLLMPWSRSCPARK
jgi:MFS family permease